MWRVALTGCGHCTCAVGCGLASVNPFLTLLPRYPGTRPAVCVHEAPAGPRTKLIVLGPHIHPTARASFAFRKPSVVPVATACSVL